MSDRNTQCGFVGLGSQGAPIARRMLDGGFPTALWARNPATLEPFRGTGAQRVDTIEELGARSDHVGICVRDDADVIDVAGRLLETMRPGSRLVIHSTTLPATCIALAKQAEARGVILIEAPVSGGGPGAEAGELTVMTAGDRDMAEAAQPVFATFASLVIHLGGFGAAQTAKLINNSLLAANLGLVQSAFALGAMHGLDRGALLRMFQASSARSYALDVFGRMPEGQSFSHAKTLFDKVRLLGEAGSADSPHFAALRDAARALCPPD